MKTINISIKVPGLDELLNHPNQVCLNLRKTRNGTTPFTKEALEKVVLINGEPGVYVHLWKKSAQETVVRYVGQTKKSFRKRLNRELTLENACCSKEFCKAMLNHMNDRDIVTVLFPDAEIAKLVTVSGCKNPEGESLRLLLEQAMVTAYNSEDLLNVHK